MNFAAQSGLWLALIALPVLGFYLLKIKRHRRQVPYLKLWADLVGERHFNTLFQKLQRWLSLLLQMLIAACLVGAFASLTLSDSFLEEESVILVVDTSASMQGREVEDATKTRFAAALDRARELVEGRSAEDEFAIVAAGPQPEVLQGFTRSTLRLREALQALEPTRAVGDLVGAVRLARDLLQGKEHPRILLLTDACGGRAAELSADDDVRWLRVGESVANVSVQRFQVRKNFSLGTDYLLLVVANASDESTTVEAQVWFEDKLRLVVPLELEPGEERSVSRNIAGALPQGGFAKVVLNHVRDSRPDTDGDVMTGDGLELDDVAYAVVQPTRVYSVLLVTRDDAEEQPFRAALDALDVLVDRNESAVARPDVWRKMSQGEILDFDLVLFVNWSPPTLPERGRFFAVNTLPGDLPAKLLGVESTPRFRDVDPDHPLNRFLQAKSMQPREVRPLDLTGGEPFLATAAGPVGVVFANAERKVVYLGVDVLSDLFFLQVAFPLIVRNALAWMHEESTAMLDPTYHPCEVVRPRFAVKDSLVTVGWTHQWTDAEIQQGRRTLDVRDGRFYFADTDEPGRYWIDTADGRFRTAVNLFDRGESDLTMPTPAAEGVDAGLERAGFLFGRDLWPLLLLVAAGLWLCEWCLFHRRITQ